MGFRFTEIVSQMYKKVKEKVKGQIPQEITAGYTPETRNEPRKQKKIESTKSGCSPEQSTLCLAICSLRGSPH